MDISTEIISVFWPLATTKRKALLKTVYKETEILNTNGNMPKLVLTAKACPHCQSNVIT